jgi:hydroxysqualene dehydroxylase
MGHEVLIIGSGFAGLAAGVALAETGRPVRLLEQNRYLGGRARSFRDAATGSVVDNGQHILMGCYRSTLRFLAAIGAADQIRFQAGLKVSFLEAGGRLTEFRCPWLPAPLHVFAGVLLSRSFSFREKMEVVKLGHALRSGKARPDGFDRMTVDQWLAALGQSEGLRKNFWNLLAIAAMNEDPQLASAALFERVLRLALFSSPADSRIGVPRRGLSECYTQAAETFIRQHGGSVELGRGVRSVEIEGDRVTGVRLSSGECIEAEGVISAVPWFALREILPQEALAHPFFSGLKLLEPAPIVSIDLWFDPPLTQLDFAGLRGTTIQWVFSKPGGSGKSPPYVSLVLSGAHAHVNRSKEELVAMAVRELGELLPAASGAQVVRALVIKERLATFSPRPGSERHRPAARTPVRGFYLAGDWTDTGLPATIEGAVKSGYTAVESLLMAN